jgi:hypothetical protein
MQQAAPGVANKVVDMVAQQQEMNNGWSRWNQTRRNS